MGITILVVLVATIAANPNDTPKSDLEQFKGDWARSLSAVDMHDLINTLFDLVVNSGSQDYQVSYPHDIKHYHDPTRASLKQATNGQTNKPKEQNRKRT